MPKNFSRTLRIADQIQRELADLLQHEIKVYVGSSVEIDLRAEGGVERSQGKAKVQVFAEWLEGEIADYLRAIGGAQPSNR